jgi:hypothetical protein
LISGAACLLLAALLTGLAYGRKLVVRS